MTAKMPEPVAKVIYGFQIVWIGTGPIAPLVQRNGVKVGSQLITTEQAEAYAQSRVDDALREYIEGGQALRVCNDFNVSSEPDPVERLRFFCSVAMRHQDWLDVEQFFDDVVSEIRALKRRR